MNRYESRREEDAEAVREVVKKLSELGPETVILVEGKRDREALIGLGVHSEIYVINDGKSVVETSEIISRRYRSVVILTDWDRTGGRLARAFAEQFVSLGVDYSLEERKELAFLCKKEIKDVESLAEYMKLC